ncbi:IS3 family transposase [Rhodovulum sp. YEN HP10]|uniref:IS3 family transposase n=1 Tax=Rhodovulum sp. HP10 TaxID=3387397 RepID=UPI0039E05B40
MRRDAGLKDKIRKIWSDNRKLYGARKVWHALKRDNVAAARCTVERLMREMGLQGVIRGKKVITTNPDTTRPCPDGKVNREFRAERPNQLWVSDFTCPLNLLSMLFWERRTPPWMEHRKRRNPRLVTRRPRSRKPA